MRRFSLIAVILSIGLIQGAAAWGSVLFYDSFDRDDSRNIDATLSGITDNTGSSLAADIVYTHAFIDPNNADPTNGVQDGNAVNGGGAQILNQQLELAVGAGTSNAFINHNFINPAILLAGGFSVSVDLGGCSQSTAGQGGGFGIGMSLAEALSTGDAQNGDLASGPSDWKMQDGLQGGGNAESDVAVSDFWVVLRGDGYLQYGSQGHSLPFNQPPDGHQPGPAYLGGGLWGAKSGTLRVDFAVPDFNDGTTVGFRLYVDDTFIDAGTFQWTGSNENYIGLDGRDSTYVRFDNLTISAVPEPSMVLLTAISLGLAAIARRRLV